MALHAFVLAGVGLRGVVYDDDLQVLNTFFHDTTGLGGITFDLSTWARDDALHDDTKAHMGYHGRLADALSGAGAAGTFVDDVRKAEATHGHLLMFVSHDQRGIVAMTLKKKKWIDNATFKDLCRLFAA